MNSENKHDDGHTMAELLPGCILRLNDRVDGGIPEPHRSVLFDMLGMDKTANIDTLKSRHCIPETIRSPEYLERIRLSKL